MVKNIATALSLFIFFYAGNAYASICPDHKPKTTLHYRSHNVEYIRDVSSEDLRKHHFLGGHDASILGLAGGEVGIKFEVKFEAEYYKDKYYCLRTKHIGAKFYAKPKIYIASNFSRGSCEYNKTLKHENEHVKILRRAHKEYTPKYRRHLYELSKNIPVLEPVKLIDVNTQKDVLLQHISQGMQEYMNVITLDVAERQKKIDTPEEYKRVYSKCDRWEEKLNE